MLSAPSAGPRPRRTESQAPYKPTQEIVSHYRKGLFTDPARQRAYFKGPDVLTQGHKSLIEHLRGEASSLSSENAYLRKRVDHLKQTVENAHHGEFLMNELHCKKHEALVAVTEELREAHASLREMDELLKQSRTQMDAAISSEQSKRRNRLSVLSQAHGVAGQFDNLS